MGRMVQKKNNEKRKKDFSGQSFQFLNINRLCFVEFWKIILVFAQEKGL